MLSHLDREIERVRNQRDALNETLEALEEKRQDLLAAKAQALDETLAADRDFYLEALR